MMRLTLRNHTRRVAFNPRLNVAPVRYSLGLRMARALSRPIRKALLIDVKKLMDVNDIAVQLTTAADSEAFTNSSLTLRRNVDMPVMKSAPHRLMMKVLMALLFIVITAVMVKGLTMMVRRLQNRTMNLIACSTSLRSGGSSLCEGFAASERSVVADIATFSCRKTTIAEDYIHVYKVTEP